MRENHYDIQCHCDLDLWHSNPKINRDHLLGMISVHVKYEDFVINGFQDNQRKRF